MKRTGKKTAAEPKVDPAWPRLAQAVAEIVTSDAAPWSLKQPMLDFLHSEAGEIWGKFIVTPPMIQQILIEASVNASLDDEVSDAAN